MANHPGIEISQTDLDGTDLKDMTMSSDALSPKSVTEGDGSVITNVSGVATTTVLHNIPYPPTSLFWFNPGNTNAILHPGVSPVIDRETNKTWGFMDNVTFRVIPNATTDEVLIQGVPNTTYRFHYFIFEEPANSTNV